MYISTHFRLQYGIHTAGTFFVYFAKFEVMLDIFNIQLNFMFLVLFHFKAEKGKISQKAYTTSNLSLYTYSWNQITLFNPFSSYPHIGVIRWSSVNRPQIVDILKISSTTMRCMSDVSVFTHNFQAFVCFSQTFIITLTFFVCVNWFKTDFFSFYYCRLRMI